MQLEGKVAVITGGSRGIGRAIAETFIAEGAAIAFNGRDEAQGAKTRDELAASGARVWFTSGDARSSADAKRLTDGAVEQLGKIDILVNNAGGVTEPAFTVDMTDEAFENDIVWNLNSAFYATRHALKHMIPQEWGRIINISSTSGKLPRLAMAGYVSSKHGLNGLTKTVALEVGRYGITCNAICAGRIITDFDYQNFPRVAAAANISEEQRAMMLSGAINRPNTVEEVAAMALFLTSEAGAGITGGTISVDCGTAPY
ncbi:MAG: SDR family NAD(P)-dependent oxidoreductase [Dehalococcoidia bacterium]|nr:SDR family NAD(P)-dependent oxidoreductase [Dehalococcoidia bacterium]